MKKTLTILILFVAYSSSGQSFTVNTQVKHSDTLFLKTITYNYHFDSTLKYVAKQYFQGNDTSIIIHDTTWYYQRFRVIDSQVEDSSEVNHPNIRQQLRDTADALRTQVVNALGNKLSIAAAISTYEPIISSGTSSQYFRGDKSLATFPTTTASFSNSTNKNFVTDAQLTVIGNTSNINTGDNATNSQYSGLVSNATHTGDATGSTALTVVRINGTSLAGLATGILKNTTGTGVPSIAAQADITALLGAGSITNTMLANAAVANLSGANSGDNANNTQYANDFRTANFVAGTNYQVPITAGDVTTSGATSTIGASKVTNTMLAGSIAYSKLSLAGAILNTDLAGSIDLTTKVTGILPAANGGTGVNNSTRTLTLNTNSVTLSVPTASTTQTLPIATSTIVGKVALVDIAARSTAVTTTTIFTPTVSGMFRLSIYMKITTTGTSPVAGPVTITYTEPDGSVAQSHVMLLQSVTGTVVTTTVNNSTTTGTVNGSMTFFAKTGVAIQYAIAVSGTFGAGAYTGHIILEAL